MIVERRLTQPAFQARTLVVVQHDVLQRLCAAHTAEKLHLAELYRLEAARRIQVVAKGIEFLRRHRLEDIDLLFEQPLNRVNAAEELRRAQKIIGVERRDRRLQLVQELLEPELIDLMDNDEEQLVMVRRIRERPL